MYDLRVKKCAQNKNSDILQITINSLYLIYGDDGERESGLQNELYREFSSSEQPFCQQLSRWRKNSVMNGKTISRLPRSVILSSNTNESLHLFVRRWPHVEQTEQTHIRTLKEEATAYAYFSNATVILHDFRLILPPKPLHFGSNRTGA